MDQPTEFTVGQLAGRSGVTISALHFYERQNLITSWRTTGNQRRYDSDALHRVALIRIATRLGIRLSAVAAVLALFPDGHAPSPSDWRRLSGCWQAELERRMRHLQRLREDIAACAGCGCTSIDHCPLARPRDGRRHTRREGQ